MAGKKKAMVQKVPETAPEAATPEKAVVTMQDVNNAAAAAAKAAVDAVMPAVASAIMQGNVPRVQGAAAQVPGHRPPLRRCYLCNQDERVCGAKEENHTKMVVGPKRYPEYGKWFQGARINGVCYRSDGPNHKILVPTVAVGSILAQVEGFEDDERASNRKRSGGGELGQLYEPGLGQSKVKASNDGWR